VIECHSAVSPRLLPHLRDRPLVVVRHPNRVHAQQRFQDDASEHLWVGLHRGAQVMIAQAQPRLSALPA